MNQECCLCGSKSKAILKTLKIIKTANDTNAKECIRIRCPYYSSSEVNSSAYERFNGSNECFKEKYNCCHCMHRFYSPEFGDFYCFYDYLDNTQKEMYYLKPLLDNMQRKQIIIRYWICPICKAKIELSFSEKIKEAVL